MGLRLRMAPTAWAKLRYMCTSSDTEIGGFGVSSSKDPLLVTEFHLIKQECTGATVELDDEALAEYVEDQVALGRHPSECLRIWIHTHPSKSTTPSNTDWEMFKEKFTECDWSLMAIMGSDGDTSEGHLWITYPDCGFITLPSIEIEWSLPITEANPEDWAKELKEKVSTPARSFTTITSSHQKHLYKGPYPYSAYSGYMGENFDTDSNITNPKTEEQDYFGSDEDAGFDYRSYTV